MTEAIKKTPRPPKVQAPKTTHGGARAGAGRAGARVRQDVLSILEALDYSPITNLVEAAKAARKRKDHALAVSIDKELLSYQIAKPRAKQEVELTTNPVKELMEEIWEESKEESKEEDSKK